MLRFCGENLISRDEGFKIVEVGQVPSFDDGIWHYGKERFRQGGYQDSTTLQVISVLDVQGSTLCYGWQDIESNRELRMLKELQNAGELLQFKDIFPDVRQVVVYGCNELAYYFVKYLEKCAIPIVVCGKYWEYLGYQSIRDFDDGIDQMIVTAEPVLGGKTSLFQRVVRSASPEFECIDQIYEANVLAGKIKDTLGNFDWFLEQLRGKDVVIFGTDERAQDAYDLLYQHGIDIWGFAERKADGKVRYVPKMLLGKKVSTVWDIMRSGKDIVFVDVYDSQSALGTVSVDFFDYYGYRRNEQFWLLNDYTDIPYGNLVHVLRSRKVLLAGDVILCSMLAEYMEKVQDGNISVRYIEISECDLLNDADKLLFTVCPNGCINVSPSQLKFSDQLERIGDVSYSNYFSRAGAFVFIDAYMNSTREKYAHEQLIPKGILMGAMPGMSGNALVRGLLDGHPNICLLGYEAQYYDLGNMIFWYCICMAWEEDRKSKGFNDGFDSFFPGYNSFKEDIKKSGLLDEGAVSQEFFVAFHIDYMSRVNAKTIEDMSQMVIYWEPHNFPRIEIPFLARWLESDKLEGYTLTTRRNNLVWYGSQYKWNIKESHANRYYWLINGMTGSDIRDKNLLKYWEEFVLRFEDIKLHPESEMMKVCNAIGIPWSDTLLHTTSNGLEMKFDGSVDFDIKPVFNSYDEFLSEFDHFRVALLSAPYQKRYGYIYEDCLKFTRKELQEMFLKPFRFHSLPEFENSRNRMVHLLYTYDFMKSKLWDARKHAVLDDITPEFCAVDLGRTAAEEHKRKYARRKEEIEKLKHFISEQEKVILYGIGRDCTALWEQLHESSKGKILFCDKKALHGECLYQGKGVMTPKELADRYSDYGILITPSKFCLEIQKELVSMGISQKRMICNTFPLWEDDAST